MLSIRAQNEPLYLVLTLRANKQVYLLKKQFKLFVELLLG